MVYTGRQLHPRSTFAQEFVENNSEIFCLDEVQDQLTGDRRAKDQNRIKRECRKQVPAEKAVVLRGGNDTIR